ncbi:MAG TPA: FAD-dependent oxidoreductase, partial [Acidimicrobiales bacterium]|nr:FAD-dependent oxidoreductase [Acidimicrobiales bacterium]
MTAPDETPGPGAPKKAARTAKAPAKKKATTKKATPTKAAAKKAATPATAGAAKKATGTPRRTATPVAASAPSARRAPEHVHDVVIVGAGPSGASCAYWLAEAGWDVVVVEKKVFPREKTCGDGLTPRAVRQLADMNLEGALAGSHRYQGLRAFGFGRSIDMRWPEHPNFPDYGYT